jgi:hypothetical protein
MGFSRTTVVWAKEGVPHKVIAIATKAAGTAFALFGVLIF